MLVNSKVLVRAAVVAILFAPVTLKAQIVERDSLTSAVQVAQPAQPAQSAPVAQPCSLRSLAALL